MTCAAPANKIVAENCKPATRGGMGYQRRRRSDIQGFATDMSVNVGETVEFKIKSTRPGTASTSTAWAGTAATARGSSNRCARRCRCRRRSRIAASTRHQPGGLRQLEGVGVMARARRCGVGRLCRAPGARRRRAGSRGGPKVTGRAVDQAAAAPPPLRRAGLGELETR